MQKNSFNYRAANGKSCKYPNRFVYFILLTVFSLTFVQASPIDHSFKPYVTKTDLTYVRAFAVQPDGKYLVGGQFDAASGFIRNCLVRFNADGTVDPGFVSQTTGTVNALLVLGDGKILVGGSSLRAIVNGVTHFGILRLNSDGSLDQSFLNGTGPRDVKSMAVQADGKVVVGGAFGTFDGHTSFGLARLNTDGSVDRGFTALPIGGWTYSVAVLPDGDILIGGEFTGVNNQTRPSVARLNSDGSLDTTFDPSFRGMPNTIKVQTDGRILLGGSLRMISTEAPADVLRLNADGTPDESFVFNNAPYLGATNALELQPDGRILVGGNYFESGNMTRRTVFRLNQNGTLDDTFTTYTTPAVATAIGVLPSGDILVGGTRPGENLGFRNMFHRFKPNGCPDLSFAPSVGNFGAVNSLGALPNGKIYVGGEFTEVNGKERKRIARLNSDGTIDPTFNPTGANDRIYGLAVQADGKVIIGGDFGLVNGISRRRLARLNTDGSLDTSFQVGTGFDSAVNDVVVLPNGKILVGGIFSAYNDVPRSRIARLNKDGTLDQSFDVGTPGPSNGVNIIVPQPDGKILIGGSFGLINGQEAGQFARLNADGTRDFTFNQGGSGTTGQSSVGRWVDDIAVQSDGKIVIGGAFAGYNGIARNSLARTFANGALDLNFIAPTQNVAALLRQPDDKILVGGNIGAISGIPQKNLARLNADGSVDTTFDVGSGADDYVVELAAQSNGSVIIGGTFRRFDGQDHLGLARLGPAPATPSKAPFDFDGDGKTEISIFRPADASWWYLRSTDSQSRVYSFGGATDTIVPGDFTGDGKADIAIFRPTTGEWFIQRSEDNTFFSFPFGAAGDVPVPSDFDGDGKWDAAVFRPASGTWFILNSAGGETSIVNFGTGSDKPVAADYDGDGRSDIAIFRPADGSWWYLQSSDLQFKVYRFGTSTDKPVAGDYTGDGRADIAVWRPETGEWFVQRSEDNSYYSLPFGAAGDVPVPGDYDGDGRFDTAVFRPNGATWYLNRSSSGTAIVGFGGAGDRPVPNAFIP